MTILSRFSGWNAPCQDNLKAMARDIPFAHPIMQPRHKTAFTHDANGNILATTYTDTTVSPNIARTRTYTYDTYGRTLTDDGALTDVSDVTTYTYNTCTTGYGCGQLATVTDSVGNVTAYSAYNAHGQPTTIVDPNGVVTSFGQRSEKFAHAHQDGRGWSMALPTSNLDVFQGLRALLHPQA